MIDTEIFEFDSKNNYNCFEQVLNDINNLIKEKDIKKEDILEYHTENWETEADGEPIYHYRATISWWQ